jgi:hypothetical protein
MLDVLNKEEANSLLNQAYHVSSLSKVAIEQAQTYTQKMMADHTYLLDKNAQLWTYNQSTIDQPTLQANIIKRIDQDLFHLENLNLAISNYGEPGHNNLTWSLATNKMALILNGAREIILNEDHLTHLLTGQLPFFTNGYDNTLSNIPVIGDQNGLFGHSGVTYLSAAMLNVHLELLGQNSRLQDMTLENTNMRWIDETAIAHVTQIPEAIVSNLMQTDPNFTEQFTYFYTDEITPHGLAFVHSGYAFGGQRDENRYAPSDKLYGPEDCSSWIAKLINAETLFSTIDMLYAFRMAQPESERGYIDENWLNSDEAKIMNTLTPVFIHDFKDIQPGLIWAYRTFEEGVDSQLSSGKSGHTALVLGLQENGEVLTLGFQRGMPEKEGFGLNSFPAASTLNKEVMFFSINSPTLSVQDVLIAENQLFIDESSEVKNNAFVSSEPFIAHLSSILPALTIHQEEHVLL